MFSVAAMFHITMFLPFGITLLVHSFTKTVDEANTKQVITNLHTDLHWPLPGTLFPEICVTKPLSIHRYLMHIEPSYQVPNCIWIRCLRTFYVKSPMHIDCKYTTFLELIQCKLHKTKCGNKCLNSAQSSIGAELCAFFLKTIGQLWKALCANKGSHNSRIISVLISYIAMPPVATFTNMD